MSSNASTTDAKGNKNVSPAAGTSTIQLDTMSLDQLNTLKQREESRLQALSQRFSALRQAAARINAAKTAVVELYNCGTGTKSGVSASDDTTNATSKDGDKGDEPLPTTKDVFVPLTESVYVPGKIRIRTRRPEPPLPDTAATGSDNDDDEPLLLIELGTGYFVEQNTAATTDYLQRKLNLVNANSDNVTQAIQATRQNMESIAIAMRGKFIEIQARQQGQRTQQMAAIEEENEN